MIFKPSNLEIEMANWPDEVQKKALEEIAKVYQEIESGPMLSELREVMANMAETVNQKIFEILEQKEKESPGYWLR